MIRKFKDYIEKNSLFSKKDKILLAFSSGMDSVALAHLLYNSGFFFALAHCNFSLRNEESDQDEEFAKNFAQKYGLEIFTKRFETETYAREKGISIQMAARELRYNWFEEVRSANTFAYIATGHHKDDQSETLLINMVRGTGLSGLSGIKSTSGYLVRPMLCFDRKEIESYCIAHQLSYREDSTNKDVKYTRNKIRHEVIPVLKSINPSFTDAMMELSVRAEESERLLQFFIDRTFSHHKIYKGEKVFIKIDPILDFDPPALVLYQLLKEYGFQGPMINDIAEALDKQPGKIFSSHTHLCLKDRDYLIIYPHSDEKATEMYHVTPATKEIITGAGKFIFETMYNFPQEKIKPDPEIAYLNAELLKFPLVLRHPRAGDYIMPYGLSGKKKISDLLTDNKIPLTEKAKIWLLCSGDKIVWVAGMRTDKQFRLNRVNKKVLIVRFMPS